MSKLLRERPAPSNELQSKYVVNEQIRVDRLTVINQHGENIGVVTRSQALALAEEGGLDLVQVGEKDSLVVAKIMDFGKFVYAKKKQVNDSKKYQTVISLKEIKIRPNIGDHDYMTKLKKAVGFFAEGKKVKFTLQFKGREITMMDVLGHKIFGKVTRDLQEHNVGSLVEEKDQRSGAYWSKIYFVK